MTSYVDGDNKGKDILILGEIKMQELDNTTLKTEAINFTQSNKRLVLSLLYNRRNSFLFVNATKIHHFKAKNSEINYALCLNNISKDFTNNNLRKNRIKRSYKISFY